jgi:oligogalacturonide lyase
VIDPLTENDMIRLTDPKAAHRLPLGSYVASRANAVLTATEQGGTPGKPQIARIDLRTGLGRILTEAEALDAASPSFTPDERWIQYIDGKRFLQMPAGGGKERELYVTEGAFEPVGVAVTVDGLSGYVVERMGGAWRLIQAPLLTKGTAGVLAESGEAIGRVLPRPKRASVAYHRGGAWWMVNTDGKQNRKLPTAEGAGVGGFWSADGTALWYLANGQVRVCDPDANRDQLWAKSSQFVQMGRNGDGSVLVGMSGSKAGPYVLITLRVTKRERPLVAHKASHPGRTPPVFSPNSQRIFFESDFEGNPAVYMLLVDRLVEKIEAEGSA